MARAAWWHGSLTWPGCTCCTGCPPGPGLLALAAVAGACWATYLAAGRRLTALDAYALAGASAVTVMFLLPKLYYTHYGAFDGPFLALTAALPAGALRAGAPQARTTIERTPRALAPPIAAAAAIGLIITAACGTQLRGEARQYGDQLAAAAARLIPPGACALTNDAAYAVAANRFTSDVTGCPSMVDSFGTLFSMTGGRSRTAPAAELGPVAQLWQQDLERAQYVWITSGHRRPDPVDRRALLVFRPALPPRRPGRPGAACPLRSASWPVRPRIALQRDLMYI